MRSHTSQPVMHPTRLANGHIRDLTLAEAPCHISESCEAHLDFLREVACCLAYGGRLRSRLVLSAWVGFVHNDQRPRAHGPGSDATLERAGCHQAKRPCRSSSHLGALLCEALRGKRLLCTSMPYGPRLQVANL